MSPNNLDERHDLGELDFRLNKSYAARKLEVSVVKCYERHAGYLSNNGMESWPGLKDEEDTRSRPLSRLNYAVSGGFPTVVRRS